MFAEVLRPRHHALGEIERSSAQHGLGWVPLGQLAELLDHRTGLFGAPSQVSRGRSRR
jgi:hypothetical protein